MINFDRVKIDYLMGLSLDKKHAKSVDAIFYADESVVHFVEFKSGDFEPREITKKAYDSVLIYMDITGQTIDDIRKNGSFTLVISKDKYERLSWMDRKAMGLANKGDIDFAIYGLGKMRGYIFKKVICKYAEEYDKWVAGVKVGT